MISKLFSNHKSRYRLLDYFYTAFHRAHTDGTPVLHPLFFKYPKDSNTFPIEHQFFFGDSILVSPVTDDDATSVSIYLPEDIFYKFDTLEPVQGSASSITLNNVNFTQIPLHIKGGAILPLRAQSTMTTTELRKQDFEIVVAPDMGGRAEGTLYVDDGELVTPPLQTNVKMVFADGELDVSGNFDFPLGVDVKRVRFLGVGAAPPAGKVMVNGKAVGKDGVVYDPVNKVLDVTVGMPFVRGFNVKYHAH